ncbi:MAG TPA: hypothetical protein VMQ17_09130 [Candidatus Sulfotelmatobacter sp.]|nr:hypothetical protein [Candidatus Sulfotelmatobacter sp.]
MHRAAPPSFNPLAGRPYDIDAHCFSFVFVFAIIVMLIALVPICHTAQASATGAIRGDRCGLQRESDGAGFDRGGQHGYGHAIHGHQRQRRSLRARTSFVRGVESLSRFPFHGLDLSVWLLSPAAVHQSAGKAIAQLGAINELQSAASSNYNGVTLSLNRRVARGAYLRLSCTYARAIDD